MAHHVPQSSTRNALMTIAMPLNSVRRSCATLTATTVSQQLSRRYVTCKFLPTQQFLRHFDYTSGHSHQSKAIGASPLLSISPGISPMHARSFSSSTLSPRTGPQNRRGRSNRPQDTKASTADIFIDQFVKSNSKSNPTTRNRQRPSPQETNFSEFSGNPSHARAMILSMDISTLPAYLKTLPNRQMAARQPETGKKLRSFFHGMIRAMESLTRVHASDPASVRSLPPVWSPFICSFVLTTFARYRQFCPQIQAYTISALLQPLLREYPVTGNGHRLLSASESVFDLGFVSPLLLDTLEKNMEKSLAEGTLFALRPKTIKAYVQLLDRGVSLPVLSTAIINALHEACPTESSTPSSPTDLLADLWWQRWRDLSIVSTPNMAPSIGSQLVLTAPSEMVPVLRKCLPAFYERTVAPENQPFCGIDTSTPLSMRATLFALRSLLDLAVLTPPDSTTTTNTNTNTNVTIDKEYITSILPLLTRLHHHLMTLYEEVSPEFLEDLFLTCKPGAHTTIRNSNTSSAHVLWSHSPRYPLSSNIMNNPSTRATKTPVQTSFTVNFDYIHLLSVLILTVHERTKLFKELLANDPGTTDTSKTLDNLLLPSPLLHLAQQVIRGPAVSQFSNTAPTPVTGVYPATSDASTSYLSSVQGVVAWRLRHLLQYLPSASATPATNVTLSPDMEQALARTPQHEEHAVGSWLLDIAYPTIQFGVEVDGMSHFRPPSLRNISAAMEQLARQLESSKSRHPTPKKGQRRHQHRHMSRNGTDDDESASLPSNASQSSSSATPAPLVHWTLTEESNIGPAVGHYSLPANRQSISSSTPGASTTPSSVSTLSTLAWGHRFDEVKLAYKHGIVDDEYNTSTHVRARDLALRGWTLCRVPSPTLPRLLRTRYNTGLGSTVSPSIAPFLTPAVLQESLEASKERSTRGGGGTLPLALHPWTTYVSSPETGGDIPAESDSEDMSNEPLEALLDMDDMRIPMPVARMCIQLDAFLSKAVLPPLLTKVEKTMK